MKQNIPRTLDCLGLVEDWHVLHCFATNGETYGGYRMEMNEKWYAQRRILWISSFLARAIWRAIWIHLLRTCPTLCPLKLLTCFPKIGRWSEIIMKSSDFPKIIGIWSEIIINHPKSEDDPKASECHMVTFTSWRGRADMAPSESRGRRLDPISGKNAPDFWSRKIWKITFEYIIYNYNIL